MNAGLAIGGTRYPVPSVELVTWLDDPKRAPHVTDGTRRPAGQTSAVLLHTTRGVNGGKRRPGSRPSTHAESLARYQTQTARSVSWHITIDTDGTVIQQADAELWHCWHAGYANDYTVGIEVVQQKDSPDHYDVQLVALVAVVGVLCDALKIPRRLHVDARGEPWIKPVPSLLPKDSVWSGVLGHCNVVTANVRGPGDPGVEPMRALLTAGWSGVVMP